MKKALSLEQTVNRFLLCVAVWIFLQSIITPRLTALAPMLSALSADAAGVLSDPAEAVSGEAPEER